MSNTGILERLQTGVLKGKRKAGFKGKIMVGGAPVTQDFASKIGADLYAADAAEGAEMLRAAVAAAA